MGTTSHYKTPHYLVICIPDVLPTVNILKRENYHQWEKMQLGCFQSLQKLRACTLVCNGLRLLDRNYFLLRSISILSQDKRANMTLYPRFFSSWMVRGQIATHLKIRCPQTWQPAMRSASQFLYAKMVKCRRRRRRHLALHHYPQLPWWENLLHRHLWH